MATKKEETAQAEPSTEVALKKQQAMAVQAMMMEDAGSGFEEASAATFAIPFIQILQSGSPQCKKSDGAYIKGAEEGMLYNTVTGELYDGEKGIKVIPCHFTHRFNEWKLREEGGGFIGEHKPDALPPTRKDEKGRDITTRGNQLVDTRNHYVLVHNEADDTWFPALMAMSSTQLRKSRNWMTQMQSIKVKRGDGVQVQAPMFSRIYHITTQAESNDKGSWFGYRVQLEGIVDDPAAYAEAKAFRAAVVQGLAAAKQPAAEEKEEPNFAESGEEQF